MHGKDPQGQQKYVQATSMRSLVLVGASPIFESHFVVVVVANLVALFRWMPCDEATMFPTALAFFSSASVIRIDIPLVFDFPLILLLEENVVCPLSTITKHFVSCTGVVRIIWLLVRRIYF